jgi:thiamine-phosphate pyrophosphorylase
MDLIVISNPSAIDNEADIINALFAEGLNLFHLRKPKSTEDEISELLSKIDSKYHSKIALHQHYALAERFQVKRIHFSESLRLQTPEDALIPWKERGFILSTSIHSLNSIASLSSSFSYAFLGPFFESISKPGYGPDGKNMIILEKTSQRNTRIIALGGITPDKIDKVKHANFDGAAVLGFIWNNPDNAVANFKACLDKCVNYV